MKRLNVNHAPAQVFRLEKSVPVSVILGGIVQLVMLVSWAVYLEARVSGLERFMQENQPVSEKLARLEERIEALRGDVRRVLDKK